MGYFRFFFTQTGLFTALYPYTLRIKKFFTKNPAFLKLTKFDGDSVKNESAGQKTRGGGGLQKSPACLGLTALTEDIFNSKTLKISLIVNASVMFLCSTITFFQ